MNRDVCAVCGAPIVKNSRSRQKLYCSSACAEKARPARRREQKAKSKTRASGLTDVLRELNEYNRRHNTAISYGKWVVMKQQEEANESKDANPKPAEKEAEGIRNRRSGSTRERPDAKIL